MGGFSSNGKYGMIQFQLLKYNSKTSLPPYKMQVKGTVLGYH